MNEPVRAQSVMFHVDGIFFRLFSTAEQHPNFPQLGQPVHRRPQATAGANIRKQFVIVRQTAIASAGGYHCRFRPYSIVGESSRIGIPEKAEILRTELFPNPSARSRSLPLVRRGRWTGSMGIIPASLVPAFS